MQVFIFHDAAQILHDIGVEVVIVEAAIVLEIIGIALDIDVVLEILIILQFILLSAGIIIVCSTVWIFFFSFYVSQSLKETHWIVRIIGSDCAIKVFHLAIHLI